jgi:phosphoglycerate kinase
VSEIKTIKDLELTGKRVFVRVDFNVPLVDGEVSDRTRIKAALPTIRHLMDQQATVLLASHLGRPKGQKIDSMSLRPVAGVLSEEIGEPVLFTDAEGDDLKRTINDAGQGAVILLENLRFNPEEEANGQGFAEFLGSLADAYINDAFGTAHRAHASTAGIASHVGQKAVGLLIEKELQFLGEKTATPARPFTVIIGGAKVSDKIKVIDALIEKADTILIGGGMAYTFKLAQGGTVGDSLCEPDMVDTAKAALKKAEAKGVKFLLPVDTLVTDNLDFGAKSLGQTKVVEGNIEDGWEGVDIGPKTQAIYAEEVARSNTLLWNGPMGVFEIKAASSGTFAVAKAVGESNAISIIGGGDSIQAINNSGHAEKVSFISTGGGASLEFLEGKELPGVAALKG